MGKYISISKVVSIMRRLKTELLNAAKRNWDANAGKDYIYAKKTVATVSFARKTFEIETWRAVRRGLKELAERGLRSASVRVYETYEAKRTNKSKVLVGNEEVFVEMPDAAATESFYRLLMKKIDSEQLDVRTGAAKLSRYKTKHRVDVAWVSFRDQVNYQLANSRG